MQNKGLVRILGIALALICLFYLSFNVVTMRYESKAEAATVKAKENFQQSNTFANLTAKDKSLKLDSVGNRAYYSYLDSVGKQKVYLNYTLKECREKGVNLGLDLKGGMNVTLEISVPDILRALSNYNTTPNFNKALQVATERQKTRSNTPYLNLFVQAYNEIDPQAKLATIFSTFELKDQISLSSTNEQVITVLTTEIDAAISNSFNVLRTRIDRFGVIQPNIQKLENTGRILVELPGVKEPERVRKLLQGSANLEFWATYDLNEIINNLSEANNVIAKLNNSGVLVDSASQSIADTAKTVAQTVKDSPATTIDSLKAALTTKTQSAADSLKMLEQNRKENPLFAVLAINVQNGQVIPGPQVGVVEGKDTALVNSYLNLKQVKEVLPRDLAFRWGVNAIDENDRYYQLIAIKQSARDGRAPLTGSVITDARDQFGQQSSFAEVSMTMNAEGSKTWARMTKENIGKSIAIALDGYIYSYPTVQNEITGGQSNITGRFTPEEAKDLANVLKSGKMPAPARIVQEDVVGPSLGEEAITSGLWSFIVAFLLVMLYMIFYYGLIPGVIADIALFINVFFLMGILAAFGAVLTLPGIAGIVLTLGMAVDGNVLIYERVREEIESGKNMKKAVHDGFNNAISAIIDANVTTLITGIVLFIFGQGPIQGFATTLIIGIATSFITSVFLTRMMLEAYANRENSKQLPFTTGATKTWFQNLSIDFIGKRKVAYMISGALLLISILGIGIRGMSYGIDFSGGRNYIVQFEQKVNTEDVRKMLENTFEGTTTQVISIGSNGDKVRISSKYKIEENTETIDNEIAAKLYEGLKPLLGNTSMTDFTQKNIVNSQKVGPTIADDIKTSSIWAVLISLLLVSLYIFIRFNDFGFSMGAMASLAHDVIFIIGVFALLWGIMPFSMEIDQSFIAALLTYVGFSVNDTVVIFDRIRENIQLYPKRNRKEIINEALNDTLSRTFSTSMSVFVVLLSIFLFGGDTIRGFIFALLIGTIMGVYSTLFVAVPVAFDIIEIRKKKKAKKELATVPVTKK
ncbi:MAG: protein translocase subunit SecDF [Paludibacteraceae bacterium]|nr:protein translocase subunit SecDF [Paludibacteraceae bacterium]